MRACFISNAKKSILLAWTISLSLSLSLSLSIVFFGTWSVLLSRLKDHQKIIKCFVLDRYASFFRADDPKTMDIGTSIRNQIVQNYSKAQTADESTYMLRDRGPVRVDVMPATLYMKKSSKLYAEKSPWYIRYSSPPPSKS